jgi:hypothetical protein
VYDSVENLTARAKTNFFSTSPHPYQLWGPPTLLSNEYQGLFPLGVKQLGYEADHSPHNENRRLSVLAYSTNIVCDV